jgi:hypothetical protein
MKKCLLFFLLVCGTIGLQAGEQRPEYLRWNTFNINKLWTKFSGTNIMAAGTEQPGVFPAQPPAFEYPGGSSLNYAGFVALVVGGRRQEGCSHPAPSEKRPYVDNAALEGPAWYWDPQRFELEDFLLTLDRAPVSNDPRSWSSNWPPELFIDSIEATVTDTITGETDTVTGVWPRLIYGEDTIRADQESFSICHGVNYESGASESRGYHLDIETTMRGLAWNHPWYDDMIFWVFTVKNTAGRIDSAYIGIHGTYEFYSDFQPYGGWGTGGEAADDRLWYDEGRNLIYGTDGNGQERNPNGTWVSSDDIAWAGLLGLRFQTNGVVEPFNKVDLFEGLAVHDDISENGIWDSLFYYANLMNVKDPDDPNEDGIDEGPYDNDYDGVGDDNFKGYNSELEQSSAFPYFTIGSGPFTMEPGEEDTLILATVLGVNEADLIKNVDAAIALANNNFKVPNPPTEPKVEASCGDGWVELRWGLHSERDTTFEGYRIFRSSDGGATWGDRVVTDVYGTPVAYVPLAQYDLDNGIKGLHPNAPWFNMGDDTGLDEITQVENEDTFHIFKDEMVTNGIRYRYWIAAYSNRTDLPAPLETPPNSEPIIAGDNTLEVTPSISSAKTKAALDSIRVVPNPFIMSAGWEIKLGEKRLDFAGLPESCTIRLYNISGELIRVIEHKMGSRESWNLRNTDNQDVAPGLYFYHVESDLGEIGGKIAIIK